MENPSKRSPVRGVIRRVVERSWRRFFIYYNIGKHIEYRISDTGFRVQWPPVSDWNIKRQIYSRFLIAFLCVCVCVRFRDLRSFYIFFYRKIGGIIAFLYFLSAFLVFFVRFPIVFFVFFSYSIFCSTPIRISLHLRHELPFTLKLYIKIIYIFHLTRYKFKFYTEKRKILYILNGKAYVNGKARTSIYRTGK